MPPSLATIQYPWPSWVEAIPTSGLLSVRPPAGPKNPAFPKLTGCATLSGYEAALAVPGETARARRTGSASASVATSDVRRDRRLRGRLVFGWGDMVLLRIWLRPSASTSEMTAFDQVIHP